MSPPIFQKIKKDKLRFDKEEGKKEIYFFGFVLLIVVFFLIFLVRLFQLTIIKGSYYRQLSEKNRLREILIEPQRGKILDRKGFVLVQNIAPNINEKGLRINSKRIYHSGEAFAHLVGYRGLASSLELKNDLCLNKAKIGDKIGKKGVELVFDCQLRGKPGKKLIEVDALGNFLRTVSVISPENGVDLKLALDWQLQKKAYDLIKEKKGAVIALLPKTGEVITFVSSPSFDPQIFEDEDSQLLKNLLVDEKKPLFNRASEGEYPPGSVFKLLVAAAALEEKVIDDYTTIEDTGILKLGSLTFGNWYYLQYGKTDGLVDVVKAIQRSNDIFFYQVGGKLGEEKIKKWAEIFGLGKKTEIGIEEKEGIVPFSFWKEDKLKDKWYLGDTYNLSIGQGYLLTTPLQMAVLTSVFANNGYLCQPQLLKLSNVETSYGVSSPNCQKLPLSQKTIDLIKEAMKKACSPGGTGWPLFNFKVNISQTKTQTIETACKTGTAESQSKESLPHAWFTVFAPYDNPKIVLTVFLENAGQGSDVAGPVTKEILKDYFERKE
jgi:penicillin-binding protein 2